MRSGSLYQVTTLSNGARIATARMEHLRGVSVGVWAGVGGRHERVRECGLAHFLEHLLFKGTTRHSSKELTVAVEGVGGYLNAYTTEDHTCYYAKAGAEHVGRLSEVLLEMYLESDFPESEVETEREVIKEEILSAKDNPSQWVEELLSATLWPGQSLGRPLTGTVESVAKLTRTDLVNFRDRNYTGCNTVFTVAGPVEHERVVQLVSKTLGRLKKGRTPLVKRVGPAEDCRVNVEKEDSGQSHLALGYRAFSRVDDRRYAMRLLSVVLGENMSSRLFQSLRERSGYCYSIQSSTVNLEETGAFSVYADLDPVKLPGAIRAIRREFDRIMERAVPARELNRAKEYAIGQTRLSLDSATQQSSWMAESLFAHGRVLELEEVESRVRAVTAVELSAAARECLAAKGAGAALVGPGVEAGHLRKWVFG